MMKKVRILILMMVIFYFCLSLANGQSLKQVIRGEVIDRDSKVSLVGVNLVIAHSSPPIGTITDLEGNFKFNPLPVGRYDIEVHYMGYESKTINDILIGAGKEAVLTIELVESVIEMEGIVISAKKNKGETLNRMASVSARSFTVEETKRYAGSYNDPSRMAASFAGVAGSNDGNNDIIIRGNSPRGMLWRIEGIEIPNPNHFSEDGATGGPISILNSNMLDNSDFYTAAFPSEYGNALSGVFDIRMRKGNNEKQEYSFMASFLGTDCSVEGPFRKGYDGSYLVNYRYSTLAMLNTIGIKIAGDAVPKFQDLSMKVNLPTEKLGTYTIFAIGGISDIFEEDIDYRNNFGTDMAAIGLKHTYFIDHRTYVKTTFAATGSRNRWKYEETDTNNNFYIYAREHFIYQTNKLDISFNKKWNAKNSIRSGITFSDMNFDLFSDDYEEDEERLIESVKSEGNTSSMQAYTSWKHRITQNLAVTSGLHYMYFALNGNYSLEPRIGIRWTVNPNNTISAGFGIHSRMESLTTYFAENEDENNQLYHPNEGLDFTKSRHYVLGYEHRFTPDLLMKLEVYYQDLYNVPLQKDSSNSFTALNHDYGYTTTPLENTGTGTNYGAELTVEKFFSNSYYFLLTTSIFDSKYYGSDGNKYNSKYNGNYVGNLLGGKEWVLKNNGKKRILSVSVRSSLAGGLRYAPIDLERSREEGHTVRNWANPYSKKRDPFFRTDLKVELRTEKKKSSRIWGIDCQNVTNNMNVAGDYYNDTTDEIETYSQLGILPILSYRIEF